MLDRKIFSTRLRELREANNMSCAALAEKIGVTGASLGYYERGERVPDIETTQKLCGVFGVTSDYLLGLSDTPSPDIEDQAICKKLGIEGETLEALKKIFYNEFDNPTPPKIRMIWNDLYEVLSTSDVAEIFFQSLANKEHISDIDSNFFFCLKRYMLAVDNLLDTVNYIDETFNGEEGINNLNNPDYISRNQLEIVITSKEYHDAKLHMDATSWCIQDSLKKLLDDMRKNYAKRCDTWQA